MQGEAVRSCEGIGPVWVHDDDEPIATALAAADDEFDDFEDDDFDDEFDDDFEEEWEDDELMDPQEDMDEDAEADDIEPGDDDFEE